MEYNFPGTDVCDVEIGVISFVVNGSVTLTIPPYRHKKIKVRSRSNAVCGVTLKWGR